MIFDATPEPRVSTIPFNKDSAVLPPTRSESGLPVAVAKTSAPPADPAKLELTADLLATARGINVRNARAALRSCHLIRKVSGGGRPENVFWVGDHPKLAAIAQQIAAGPGAEPSAAAPIELWQPAPTSEPRTLDALDLKIAELRARAVRTYIHLQDSGKAEAEAAILTVGEWQEPKIASVRINERLRGGNVRRVTREESVGQFSTRTLREWARIWNESRHDLRALAPQRKGSCGRNETPIPETLLDLINAMHCSTPRANLKDSIAKVREKYTQPWPEVSYDTMRRRLAARWPEKYCQKLGKSGIAKFRSECSPDVTWDYSQIPYNFEFQCDDIEQDFYGHGSNPLRLVRPYVYATIRVSTRKWICAVACETKITADQVRAMVGFTLASRNGGIPKRFKFERGTVACDSTLEDLLVGLGVEVKRTGMHTGRIAPDAVPDVGRGNPDGKAVMESNARRLHNANQFQPSQVGTNERETAHQNLGNLKAYAIEMVKAGKMPVLPMPAEWQQLIVDAMNKNDNTPHTSLPEIVDPSTGAVRHMTPNEREQQLKDQGIDVMDEQILPLFFQKGHLIPVTKNGIKINNEYYGRFDDDIQAIVGTKVTAYADPDMPDSIYVQELGRCVERFECPKYGGEGLIAQKRHVEKTKRSEFERMRASALETGEKFIGQAIRFTANPVPERAAKIVLPEPLRARADRLVQGRSRLETTRTERAESQVAKGAFVDRRNAKYEMAEA